MGERLFWGLRRHTGLRERSAKAAARGVDRASIPGLRSQAVLRRHPFEHVELLLRKNGKPADMLMRDQALYVHDLVGLDSRGAP